MNVYDFDKTIYDGDCSVDFVKFCYRRNLSLWRHVPKQIWAFIRFKLGIIDKTSMKNVIFSFFKDIEDIEEDVLLFWNQHKFKLKGWYTNQKKESDIIISASPEFLLLPITHELGIGLIASDVDLRSGINRQPNCYGFEKTIRFKRSYDPTDIDEFYSDSLSDDPMAQLAKRSYLVTKNNIKDWPNKK
jgi:phosphatidylglycerophosphatase C